MSRGAELTKNTLIITAGRVSTQFIAFLLLPLYTSLLSTEEYGTVDFITTLVNLLLPVVSLMLDQGVFRYLLNCETEEEKRKTISGAFFLLSLTSLGVCLLYAIANSFVHNEYKIWLLLILIVTAFNGLALQTARGLRRTADYALGSFVCSASTITLNVLCIAFLRMGPRGMLIAAFAGNLICFIFLFFRLGIWRYLRISDIDKETIKDEVRYSIPLVPNQLSLWVMNSSDRIVVTFFLGAAANGVLAITHKFPTIYMTFYNIFQLAWHETGAVHYFDEDRDEFFSDLINRIITIFSTLCMGVIIVLPIVFDWLVKNSFAEAYYNIPIYLIASLCNVVAGLLGVIYVATKKTAEIAKTTALAAVINLIVSLSLIKYIGLYAASVSTFAGYFITMIYRIRDTRKYLDIRWDKRRLTAIVTALCLCTGIYYINDKRFAFISLPIFIFIAYRINKETIGMFFAAASKKTGLPEKKLFDISVAAIAAGMIICGIIAMQPSKTPLAVKEPVKEISPSRQIMFSEFADDDFTCTGMTFDTKDNVFWICNYGDENGPDPELVKADKNFTRVIKRISLHSEEDLQGIAYDPEDDILWIASDDVYSLNKSGKRLSGLGLSKFRPNGICYDGTDDTLWVLGAYKLIHIEKDGSIIKKFPFRYADQDHIYRYGDHLYVTIGADYKGSANYICKVSPETGKIEDIYRTKGSNALEGLYISEDSIYIANDGKFHDDKLKHSYISVYERKDLEHAK